MVLDPVDLGLAVRVVPVVLDPAVRVVLGLVARADLVDLVDLVDSNALPSPRSPIFRPRRPTSRASRRKPTSSTAPATRIR